MSELIRSTEIYWCEGHDRYVVIHSDANCITGINYMQGDDYEYFIEGFMEPDEDLTAFYLSIEKLLPLNGTIIEKINKVIAAHFDYKNNY